ncbi:hypothetical protein FG91_00772 [Sphingopyxis sp. LC81]|uniref:DUF2938 family protein n=1 Tax=Sphingopyxis sp. LC81 TaxID=1502850 RepID=UPI00050E5B9D|nr:DUF2938 family protein [Sphingopyxis sp. LC81]KGB56270.1 hypothetical protein FG91_00772 [Sphingopyxis sp. LC81]
MTITLFAGAIITGIFGALAFDIWNALAQRLAGIRAPNWGILGKWLLAPFAAVDGTPAPSGPPTFTLIERILGETAHYVTAILFALALILAMGTDWLAHPTPMPAIAAGLLTTIFAWFLIMPALGAGIAGTKTPAPLKLCVTTLTSHAIMGAGFYVGAIQASTWV